MTSAGEPTDYSRDFFARIDELREESHLNTRGQHVVSKVIVRRFTDDRGMVRCVNFQYPNAKSQLVGYRAAGKVTNFVPTASTSAEMLWKEVEDCLPPAIDLAESDSLLEDPAAVEVIRNMVALHYVRSHQTPAKLNSAYSQARSELKQRIVGHAMVEKEFLRRYGLYPAGREARELIVEEALAQHDEIFASGLAFRQSLERIFEGAKEWLRASQVEVIHPDEGEFLLGDTPALTISAANKEGPVFGVALGDAEQIIMPLTRRTLIAIGPKSTYGTVPPEWVDVLNTWQVRAAKQYVYFHPDSGLERFVRTVELERRP